MFTGIIEKIGKVTHLAPGEASLRIVVETGFTDLQLGESIAINGACLTVTELVSPTRAQFFISVETLQKTNLGEISAGSWVNIERALLPSTRLSGHWVQGHVDGLAILAKLKENDDNRRAWFEIPESLAKYCVEKGSITLNGVSLTINEVVREPQRVSQIGILLIPHTWENTNLSKLLIGSRVNVEIDILAKYVEQLCQPYRKP